MGTDSVSLRSSRPQCIAAPNKITTWIMMRMADALSCTISAHTHSARNLAPILGPDASDLLAITFSESQVTEIDFTSSSAERCTPQVLGTRTHESPRQFDGDPIAAMNDGHHQHIIVTAGMLPY